MTSRVPSRHAAIDSEICTRGGGRDRNRRQSVFLWAPPADFELPPVSILKPLKGVDPEIWESFCSHCEQDYPQFQLIFGVSEGDDPAVEFVRKLKLKYAKTSIELIVCERTLGTNIKVSNLVQMLPSALHDILLVNDSDIRVIVVLLRQLLGRGLRRWASAPTSFPEF